MNLVADSVYTFDDANRLTGLVHNDAALNAIANYGWQFDAAGRITQFTSTDGTATYGYDETNQLTSETYVGQVSNLPNKSYIYDGTYQRGQTYQRDLSKGSGLFD